MMDILIIALAALCLWDIKFSKERFPDYIGKPQTESVKGIFTVLILFSHMRGYIVGGGNMQYNCVFNAVMLALGQMVVVMFLFYSGYGVTESLKRNRREYTRTFIRKRFLKVWLMFAAAVSLYLTLSLILGIKYTPRQYALCWIGYESIGNSNWFVFDILVLYLATYAGMKLSDRMKTGLGTAAATTCGLAFCIIACLIAAGKQAYWFDTIMAYPAGMLYSLGKEKIERRTASPWQWVATLCGTAALFAATYLAGSLANRGDILADNNTAKLAVMLANHLFSAPLFAVAVVLATMRIKPGNGALHWIGINAFSIYILQRLVMIVAAKSGLGAHGLAFALVVTPIVMVIAAAFTQITDKMNRALFS